MRNSEDIREEIAALAREGQAIFEATERAGRDLTKEEEDRFQEITKKEPGGLIYDLKKELTQAEEREAAYREISKRDAQRSALDELDQDVFGPTTRRPDRVLPDNGILPSERQQEPPRIHVRMSKLKAFKNEKDAYDCGMWVRALVTRLWNRPADVKAEAHIRRLGWEMRVASTEGSGASGGYVVPAPLAQTIIDVRETVGVARRIARILPMTSDTLDIPRREGGLTVYYPGEAGTITTSDKSWGNVSYIVKKRAVATQISQELQDDALISIVDDAVNEMAYALADKEDAEMINGDGTSTYGGEQGLLSLIGAGGVATAATGHDLWTELDAADFTACMGKLPDKYGRMPVWVCSRNFYFTSMVHLFMSGGGNTVASLERGMEMFGPNTGMFMGSPVYFTDKMPKTTAASTISALYGTFDMGVTIGDRMGISIGRSEDFAFLQDLTTLKATARYDINVHAPGNATTAGAFVALKTAA